MERLIKHYSCFFDDSYHQEKFFPNLHFPFHQFAILNQNFFPTKQGQITTNRMIISVGFFLFFKSIKLK